LERGTFVESIAYIRKKRDIWTGTMIRGFAAELMRSMGPN